MLNIAIFVLFIKITDSKGIGCLGLPRLDCLNMDQCTWDYWNPPLCQEHCSILTEEQCLQSIHCTLQDSICQGESCLDQQDQETCNNYLGWRWQNGTCYDDSCIVLQVKTQELCPTKYCIWSSIRNICYDKKCVDYPTQVSCAEISYCYWNRYRCMLNSTSVMYQY